MSKYILHTAGKEKAPVVKGELADVVIYARLQGLGPKAVGPTEDTAIEDTELRRDESTDYLQVRTRPIGGGSWSPWRIT